MVDVLEYKSVNVLAEAGDEEGVYILFNDAKLNDMKQTLGFSLTKDQTKWLIIALKQARELAYK